MYPLFVALTALAVLTINVKAGRCAEYHGGANWSKDTFTLIEGDAGDGKSWTAIKGVKNPARNIDEHYDFYLKVSTGGTVSISTTPSNNANVLLRQFQYTVHLRNRPSIAYWFQASKTDSCTGTSISYNWDEVQSITVKYRV